MKTIYLDNGATTELYPEVISDVNNLMSSVYGNASSQHHIGRKAKKVLDKSREIIANSLNANPSEIVFLGSGTEANNLVIKGIVPNLNKKHLIISKIEHDCILNSSKYLESTGFEVTYLDVDEFGFISLDDLKKSIRDDTALVSIIHGNNEIGTIQNISEIYSICKSKGVLFHTDACQSYMKTKLDSSMADLITINSHKIHGPKGIAALYIKEGIRVNTFIHGGGHEFNIRSGTENIPAIGGFAKAVEMKYSVSEIEKVRNLRNYLVESILEIPGTILNGPKISSDDNRLFNNVNISFKNIEGESIIAMLDLAGICVSTGSACSSHSLDSSHVIMALEENHERSHSSIRFTLSKFTTKDELDFVILKIKEVVETLRKISPFGFDNLDEWS